MLMRFAKEKINGSERNHVGLHPSFEHFFYFLFFIIIHMDVATWKFMIGSTV